MRSLISTDTFSNKRSNALVIKSLVGFSWVFSFFFFQFSFGALCCCRSIGMRWESWNAQYMHIYALWLSHDWETEKSVENVWNAIASVFQTLRPELTQHIADVVVLYCENSMCNLDVLSFSSPFDLIVEESNE